MFILVLLFLILAGFFTAFRFPNLTSFVQSRLRLPRFNFSKAFRNPKIKALLNDRYFFYQNIEKISKGSLFVVVGKDADKLYETILKAGGDINVTQNDSQSITPWTERGASEAFAILNFSNVNYLFIHPTLYEKGFEENFGARIRFLIKRLYKARRQNFIEGILITVPAIPLQAQKSNNLAEKSDEISYLASVFQDLSEAFQVKLPLFLLEHNFSPSDERDLGKTSEINLTDETQSQLGFFCDFAEKTREQKHADFIQSSFIDFIPNFHIKFKKLMDRAENFKLGIESIYVMHHVESLNASLIQGFVRSFFKRFAQKDSLAPASLHILNSILFSGTDSNQRLKSVFYHLSIHGKNQVVVSDELLEKRKRKNTFLFVFTVAICFLFSFSIWQSNRFLNKQRAAFNIAIADFTILSNSIHSSLSNSQSDEFSLSLLEETSCRIMRSYTGVKNISFRYQFLFPSWTSNIATQLQSKYKNKFSLLFSNFLFQKYAAVLNENLAFKPLSSDASVNEAFIAFKNYASFLYDYNIIYEQLTSNKPDQINKALTSISKLVYKNKCVEDENSFDFLTKIDLQKFAEFIKPPASVQTQASGTLKDHADQYFSAVLNRSTLMSASLNLNDDILDFGNLVESFESDENDDDADSLNSVRSAIEKSLKDYEILTQQFASDQTISLGSAKDFLGKEFTVLMEMIQQNKIFDNQTVSLINASVQKTFESFKQQIDLLTAGQQEYKFPVLVLDSKTAISINPKIINLFSTIKKFNELLPNVLTTDAVITKKDTTLPSDLHQIVTTPTLNIAWVDRKLQAFVQKYENLQTQYNLFDFDTYPDTFSEYLQDYILDSFERYWSQALASSLIEVQDVNPDNTQENSADPYGLVSSLSSLKRVVEFLVAEHFDNVLSDFDEIYKRQVDDILKQKTIAFDKKDLFGGENADFKSWDGTNSPAYDLFHASSDEILTGVMEKQKQILSDFYSQYIDKNLRSLIPIMQLRPNLHSFYYTRWYSIQLALEDKTKSYQNFYNFVMGDLKKFRVDDCPHILDNSREPGLVSDYFESRVEYLYGKLNERCRVIYMGTAIDHYEELAKSFNELVAGKYPFVRIQNGTDYTAAVADIQDLAKVLEKFQTFSKENLSFLLKYNSNFEGRTDIVNFISQMTKINSFFRKPEIDGIFYFRSRKNEEILANRIVDWELKIGDRAYGSLYGNLQNVQFKAKYGELFGFTLFFSKDVKPKATSIINRNATKIVRSNLISYAFRDSWSLLRFIDQYTTCSDSNSMCSREKLRFEIPLENNETVILFCDLNLLDADGKQIVLPVFPTRAPYLRGSSNF